MKALILSMLTFAAVPAWAAKTVAVVQGDVDAVKSLDEIVVQGDRTLSAARRAIDDAEDRFYARWNGLNGDRRFDIECHLETPGDHPSRMTYRICQPRFIAELHEQVAQETVAAITGTTSTEGAMVMLSTANPAVMSLTAELKKRTLEMINKDPELKRALLERARLEQHYEALRKAKFKDRWIVRD